MRHGLEIGGAGLGVVTGEALALPATISQVISGDLPGAGLIAYGAGKTGEAGGLTGADAVNAEIDHYYYGRETDFTLKNATKDMAVNLIGVVGANWVLEHIPLISKFASGSKDAAEDLAKATETSKTLRSQYKEESENIAKSRFGEAVEAQKKAVKEAEPSAQREIIEQTTTRTPETAAQTQVPTSTVQPGGTFGAPAEHIEAKKAFQNTYNDVRERLYQGYSKEYDTLLNPYNKNPANDVTDIAQEIKRQNNWSLRNKQDYSEPVKKLIARGKLLFDPASLTDEDMQYLGMSGKVYVPEGHMGGLGEYEHAPGEQELVSPPTTGPTLGNIREFIQLAKKTAVESGDVVDAKAASELEDAGLRAQAKQNLPDQVTKTLRNIDNRYRDFKLTFDQVTGKAVNKAGDAVAAGDSVFTNPRLTERLLSNVKTPEERQAIVDTFGDWAQTNPKSVFTDDPVKAEMRAKAFAQIDPKSPLASPKALQMISGRVENLKNSPRAMAEYEAGFTNKLTEIQTKAAIQIRDLGKGLLAKMGPIGQNVIRQVDAAKTPIEQARIVDEFFSKMDDQGFNRLVGQQQTISGRSIIEPMAGEKKGVGGLWRRMKNQYPAYLAASGLTAMIFPHASMLYVTFGTGGAALAIREKYQNYIVRTLASKYGDVAMSSLTKNGYRMLGDYTVRALADVAGSKVAKSAEARAFPDKPKPAATPSIQVGPMSRDIERKQATQIATERGRQDPTHVDQVQDLHMQVASGETPDIHADLSSGRLSNEEVTKLLRPPKPGTDSLFDNMSIADAVESFSHGTDDEKSLGLSALAQKIQNEGKNLGPAQQRALMARLRQALSGGDEGALA